MAKSRASRARRAQAASPGLPLYSRRVICEEAARIMAEQGVRDFQAAKEKAVERLGICKRKTALPTNQEVEDALAGRLRLFSATALAERWQRLLRVAADVMLLLESFNPRLVGALLRGSVTERAPVELHVFADTPEEVVEQLVWHGFRPSAFDKRVRFPPKRYVQVPGFRFELETDPVEVLAFARKEIRQAPLCPVAGRPMTRARLSRVQELLAEQLKA